MKSMKWRAGIVGTAVASAIVTAGLVGVGCSSSSSEPAAAPPVLDGTYVNEGATGDIASISFSTDGSYIESKTACEAGDPNYDSDDTPPTNPPSDCLDTGTYVFDSAAEKLTLTSASGQVTTLPFTIKDTASVSLSSGTTTQDFHTEGLIADSGTDAGVSLYKDGGPLLCVGQTADGGTATGTTTLVVHSATINGQPFTNATQTLSSTMNPGGGTVNRTVDAKYSQAANWEIVYNAVYKKISMDTAPCATFMSTALHTFGGLTYPGTFGSLITPTSFPVDPTKVANSHDRTITPATAPMTNAKFQLQANTSGLATYLMANLHWNIVWSPDNLQPGDVVFVVPADQARHPAHTYMFHQWVDQCAGFAYVIDNEPDGYCDSTDENFYAYCGADGSGSVLCCAGADKKMYKRNIKVTTPEPKDMDEDDEKMWFALRSPN